MARAAQAAPRHRSDANGRRGIEKQGNVRGEGCGRGRWRLGRQRVRQADPGIGNHESEGGMAMTAMMTIIAMRCGRATREIEVAIIVMILVMIVVMTMAVRRRSVEMPMQGMPGRPGSLERHEQHEGNQKGAAHGPIMQVYLSAC